MKTLIKASAVVITSALFAGCNFAQPEPPCIVGHGGYAASYTYVSGTSDESSDCFRKADIIGVQRYRQEDDTSMVYLKPEALAVFDYGLTGDEFTALASGAFADEFPADGRCSVPTLTDATGVLNENALAGSTTADMTYRFSNVEFVVQGSVAGTQFSADLTIEGPGCSTTYKVNAMYPVIFCNGTEEDTGFVAQTQDLTDAEPADGVPDICQHADHIWSGVAANPGFNSKCEQYGNPTKTGDDYDYLLGDPRPASFHPYTTWHICVPAADVPSLLPGRE